jgi:phosphoglycerate dehydrogenase-like enzyme
MASPVLLVTHWLPEGTLADLASRFPEYRWVDAREPAELANHQAEAEVGYGPAPSAAALALYPKLRWWQHCWAGIALDFCRAARARGIVVTNMSGLYGPSIAEHAFGLLTVLARNYHTAFRNQQARTWDREVAARMVDLRGKTLGIVGLGNIGQCVARLGRAYGMRVVGCRRTDAPTPGVDQVYPLKRLHALLAESDALVVAAPLTPVTEGLLGPAEFAAMKPGLLFVNVSRGTIAQEPALLDALRSGQVAAAGLDVFAVEPLPPEHPLWSMPNVALTPHYAGDTVNRSGEPAARLARNLANRRLGRTLEGLVDCELGY